MALFGFLKKKKIPDELPELISDEIENNFLDKNLEEDLEFARRTEEAWKSYERGEFISMPVDEFLEELSKC